MEEPSMPSRRELANAIRALSMDAIERAKSGHPGAPLGMADMAEVLFNDFLKHNPHNPAWPNRDRLVFSNGHGSMLLYSLLHLSGYDVGIDDIKNFRQMDSKTPGHPEYGHTPGVESTSGPLGQGIAMAVGMALAEKLLAKEFNREHYDIINHYTYVFMGDGCMMEGISHECCSLAGTLKLGKLIALYDDNDISIDGKVDGWMTDDTPARFRAYGWHVVENVDGHDADAVRQAILEARTTSDKPSLICCKTVIGYGAPTVCGTSGCHGSPLGAEEIERARQELNWPHAPFEIPDDIREAWDATAHGDSAETEWINFFTLYHKTFPELSAELARRLDGDLPANFADLARTLVEQTQADGPELATRKSAQAALEALAPHLPELMGGSADLSGSNGTKWSGSKAISAGKPGNYIHYGVREFAMAAIMNGMALHGGFIPYGGTFLVFSDYMKSALRSAALMKTKVVHVLTHDSIGVGEDGPTHQPIEHVSELRLMPDLDLWRPCDAVEAAQAWVSALTHPGPSALALTRQKVPHQQRDGLTVAAIARGGYPLLDCDGTPEAIILATGSEVHLAVEAAKRLSGRKIRVVSMPSVDVFLRQPADYRDAVLPPEVRARVAVEAGATPIWRQFVGLDGEVVGIDTFGASAPGAQLFEKFGFTVEAVVEAVEKVMK